MSPVEMEQIDGEWFLCTPDIGGYDTELVPVEEVIDALKEKGLL